MAALRNTFAWFCSLLLSVALFSLVYGHYYGVDSFKFVFRVTMSFALPVACLYLPIVIVLRDAEDGRMRTIAGVGVLIGPATLAIWSVIQEVRGNLYSSGGDGIGFGLVTSLFLSSIVGFMTTAFYVIALKVLHRVTGQTERKPRQLHR
jgi:hypothetical protein